MGRPRQAAPAKLFTALLRRPEFDPAPLLAQLADRYGAVDLCSAAYRFESRYYEAEMGPGLVKSFVSFETLIPQELLAVVKRQTNNLEELGADLRGRACNLDPGIITHYSVILATTKGYAHRIYLGEGIYAETTLLFRGGAAEALPWTYPDYRSAAAQAFFREGRRLLLERASCAGRAPA